MGPLGYGWDANVYRRLEEQSNGDILCHPGNGRADLYVKQPDGTFESPLGYYTRLVTNSAGFLLRFPNGTKYRFDLAGRLSNCVDRIGNTLTYLYPGTNQPLSTVVDEFGRDIDFLYDVNGLLTNITDFSGRQCNYSYDASSNLVAVRSPVVTNTPHGNDFSNGKTERYVYDTGKADSRLAHNLVACIAPNEVANGSLTPRDVYVFGQAGDDYDRCLSRTVGGSNAASPSAGGTLQYSYDLAPLGGPSGTVSKTTVTDRNGNICEYYHDAAGHCLQVIDDAGGSNYVHRMTYNLHGERLEITRPLGNRTLYVYDDTNLDRFQQGNLLSITALPDAARGGNQAQVQTTFTYEPLFNRILTTVYPRGNDPAYIPQNGGAQSAARYTRSCVYDWQEGAGAPAEAAEFGITIGAALLNQGDVNQDGRTDQQIGNRVFCDAPAVSLLPGSKQAAVEGDTTQDILQRWTFNDFGQLIQYEDPRGNIDTQSYYPENDPDGNGLNLIAGRNPTTGGYRQTRILDAVVGSNRQDSALIVQINHGYAYDERGNRTEFNDGRSNVWKIVYNALDQRVQTETPKVDAGQSNGYLRRYFYDANDNLVQTSIENETTDTNTHSSAPGTPSFFDHVRTYDILDNLVEETQDARRDAAIPVSAQPESLTTRYEYDANENVIRTISPLAVSGTDSNNVIRNQYDERDLLVGTTRGEGSVGESTWTYTYDRNGNRVTLADAEGPDTEAYLYDGYDRRIRTTDRAANEHLYRYDPRSNPVRYDCRGPVGGSGGTNVALCGYDYLYDELSRRFQVDRALFVPEGAVVTSGAAVAEGALSPGDGKVSTRYEYDALSRRTFFLRDDLACYSFEYDGADRLIRHALPLVDTNGPVETAIQYVHDGNHNIVRRVETHASPQSIQPPAVLEYIHVYDAIDRLVRATDPEGETTYLEYDSRGNVVSSYDPRGASIPDPLGLYTTTNINDHGNPVRYAYDGVNRRWMTIRELHLDGQGDQPLDTTNPDNPDGLITTQARYDGNSRVVERIDDMTNTTTYAYDALNRLTGRVHADGGTHTLIYDRDHRVTRRTNENNTVHDYTYDALDRLRTHALSTDPSKTLTNGLPFLVGTTLQTFEYDGRSRLVRCTDNNEPADTNDDTVVTYTYDSLDRLVEERQKGHAVGSSWTADDRTGLHYAGAGRVVHYAYDAHNQCTAVSNPTSLRITQDYLGNCPPVRKSFGGPGSMVAMEQTQLDLEKLPITNKFHDATGSVTGCIGIVRDRYDNVVTATFGLMHSGGVGGRSGFGTLNRTLVSTLNSRNWLTAQSEIESIVRIVTNRYNGAGAATATTTHPPGLLDTKPRDSMHQNMNRRYDASPGTGLRTQDNSFVYQWDGLNRLRVVRRVDDSNTVVAVYKYDADPSIFGGRRSEKQVSDSGSLDGTTRFVYDRFHAIEERDGSNVVTRQYIYGTQVDDILAMERDSDANGDPDDLYFYLKDFNNNVTELVDSNGVPVEFYTYDYLGPPTIRDQNLVPQPVSQFGNPYLFTARRYDYETTLYYYRARHYDPAAGEFLSRDPLGVWGDPANDGNPLQYAGNNPWNRGDPSGLQPDDITPGLRSLFEPPDADEFSSFPTLGRSEEYDMMDLPDLMHPGRGYWVKQIFGSTIQLPSFEELFPGPADHLIGTVPASVGAASSGTRFGADFTGNVALLGTPTVSPASPATRSVRVSSLCHQGLNPGLSELEVFGTLPGSLFGAASADLLFPEDFVTGKGRADNRSLRRIQPIETYEILYNAEPDLGLCRPDGAPELCGSVTTGGLIDMLPSGSPIVPPDQCATGRMCGSGR